MRVTPRVVYLWKRVGFVLLNRNETLILTVDNQLQSEIINCPEVLYGNSSIGEVS